MYMPLPASETGTGKERPINYFALMRVMPLLSFLVFSAWVPGLRNLPNGFRGLGRGLNVRSACR